MDELNEEGNSVIEKRSNLDYCKKNESSSGSSESESDTEVDLDRKHEKSKREEDGTCGENGIEKRSNLDNCKKNESSSESSESESDAEVDLDRKHEEQGTYDGNDLDETELEKTSPKKNSSAVKRKKNDSNTENSESDSDVYSKEKHKLLKKKKSCESHENGDSEENSKKEIILKECGSDFVATRNTVKKNKLKNSKKKKNTGVEEKDDATTFGQESESEDTDSEEQALDPYVQHFEYVLPEECTEDVCVPTGNRTALECKLAQEYEIPVLKQMNLFKMFESLPDPPLNKKSIDEFHLKKNLLSSISKSKNELSQFEISFLNIITNYIDVLFFKQYYKLQEKLRRAYCIHILNHILKSKARIIHHNSKMKKNPDLEYRDQGFTQPTVFILAPFRGDCHLIVNQIISLLPEKCKVMNKNRFEKEYGPEEIRKSRNKPEDFYEIFEGNRSEDFKIGLRIQNEHVTLFSDFYKSDLIIASPLGLMPIIGDQNNKHGDADFLSSIEVFIIDRLDILHVQNMMHLHHVLMCMNLMIKGKHKERKINYFRVREYALDKKAAYYRQNIFLSSTENPTFLYNYYYNHCYNYKGYMMTQHWVEHPMINFIYPAMRMCFRTFECDDAKKEHIMRRDFFKEKILPEFLSDKSTSQTLIYVPNYFDYVHLRHYFRESEISCFMLCEYTDKGKVAQGRDLFYKGKRHFMLYTERAHFYYRRQIKGIQHIIFYSLPIFPKFFREMCNALEESHPKRKGEERTCTVLVTKRNFYQLKHIVGPEEAARMLTSTQKTFVRYIGC